MAMLSLPHTLDLYLAAGDAGAPTLAKADVAGCFQIVDPAGRIRLQEIGKNPIARLWLDIQARGVVADAVLVYWREKGTWWTVRGMPEVYEQAGFAHIEAIVTANIPDSLFAPAAQAAPLTTQFENAASMTAVRVEVSAQGDFSSPILNAYSGADVTGWLFVSGGSWVPIPVSGLPTASRQRVAYLPARTAAQQQCFVRWTAYAGGITLLTQLDVATL